MEKLDSLRKAVAASVDALRVDPAQLLVFVDGGAIGASQAPGLGFEYRYTVTLTVLDYAGHTDALVLPILIWMQANQPDALGGEAMTFEAEILDNDSYDVTLKVKLTETVTASKRGDGGYDLTHADERPIGDALHGVFGAGVDAVPADTPLVELYVNGELVGHSASP